MSDHCLRSSKATTGLGIDCLDTLKEILSQTNENNLLKEVEEFEQRQNHELKSERRKGIVPSSVVVV